ncbi:MAG: TonB-dependent receptor, partial [Hyphomonadaceae bacterium]|nr:TonB-dependent receptor [Hyphomonadaceae bacterium]
MKTRRGWMMLSVAAVALVAPPAWGQDTSEDAEQRLDDVIVVAQKREQSLQDVPASITTYSGEQLESLGVSSSGEAAKQTVNMVWTTGFGYTAPRVYIRGIGTAQFYSLVQTPVGVYLDGAIVGNNIIQGFQIFDVERVETLRGPQGSLYGRNTTGGLVNYITRQPSPGAPAEGYVIASVGDFGLAEAQGAVEAPLGPNAAIRIAGNYRYREGVQDNVGPATNFDSLGETDVGALRATLAWEPGPDTRISASLRYGINRSELKPTKNIGLFCPPGEMPEIGSSCGDLFGFVETPSYSETSADLKTREETDQTGLTLQVEQDFGDITFTSISSYDDASRLVLEDTDSSPSPILHSSYLTDAEMFSQELRLSSHGDGPMNWVTGAYLYMDEVDQWNGINAEALGPGSLIPVPVAQGIGSIFEQNTFTWAAFGDVSYAVSDAITLTVGGRYTYDRRKVDGEAFVYNGTGLSYVYVSPETAAGGNLFNTINPMAVKDDWDDFSGRVVLDYRLNEDVLLYSSFSSGFRGGEFNGGALFDPAEADLVDPEKIYAYEAGAKTEWFDGRLRLNGAVFYYDYQDRQVFVQDSTGPTTVNKLRNAASTRTIGADLEAAFRPNSNLLLNMNV